jgi:hypothetical protein
MSFDPRDPPDPNEPRDPYDYRDPLDRSAPNPEAEQVARGKIMVPAVLLIVVGVLNILFGGFMVVRMIQIASSNGQELFQVYEQLGMAEEMKKQGYTPEKLRSMGIGTCVTLAVVGFLVGVINVAGGACMLRFKAWGFSVLASILAITSPSCCCVFGAAAGIWGMIALMNPEVRSAFR